MKKKPINLKHLTLFCFLFLLILRAYPLDIYVSKTGNDKNKGTNKKPIATLEKAKELLKDKAGKEEVIVFLQDGIYYLSETLVLNATHSGAKGKPVTFKAINEGKAIISGGSLLDLNWKEYKDGIYQAKTPEGLSIDQLFVDGENQRMARYPNYDPEKKTTPYNGSAADAISKEKAATWKKPKGAYIHAMHGSQWGGFHYLVTGKDANGELTYEGGWQNNRKSPMHKEYRMVENVFEELDAQGEWYHDSENNILYHYPSATTDLKSAKIEIVRLRHLIECQGTAQAPVKHIQFQGLVFRHAARTFMDTKEPLLRSDWTVYRGGALMLTGTENISVLDSEFDQVGGNAIFVNNYNRQTLVKGCHIHDAGASGVCFVGDPDAVRNPLFNYGQKNDLSTIDLTVGPKTNNYPSKGTVEDCLIHGIGRTERQPAGVLIDMAQYITIRDASIYDCARAGINIGDGAWGGHLIDRCDVFKTVQETHDHGAFNSWGRDRYWRHDHLRSSQKAVDANPKLPYLDAMATTIIRNSRWRCDHGWDIDLDDGSSNYDIYNNVMLKGGLKLREGFRRKAWNNIIVNNGFHPHVWFNNSQDEFYSNITMGRHRAILMPNDQDRGKRIDNNLFYGPPKGKDDFAKFDWDVNSIYGEPMFVDPAKGDYTIKEGAPAFKMGFKNFPMDQFGVKKPSLRAIAETPEIPHYGPRRGGASHNSAASFVQKIKTIPFYWLGAELLELKGEEFSAYGIGKDEGGLAVRKLAPDAQLKQAGVQVKDILLLANDKPILNKAIFGSILNEAKNEKISLTIVRNQKKKVITIAPQYFYATHTAKTESDFTSLADKSKSVTLSSNEKTNNDPLESLVDGKLRGSFGPVFSNGQQEGMYKLDLGTIKKVGAINCWTHNHGERGKLDVIVYGSRQQENPGWNVKDLSAFTPIASINTKASELDVFNLVSLQSEDKDLGSYRWIVFKISPINAKGENTSVQELSIDYVD